MNKIYKVIWSRVETLLCGGFGRLPAGCGKNGGAASERRACPSARFCAPLLLQDADAGGGGSEHTVWSGCFRYRR